MVSSLRRLPCTCTPGNSSFQPALIRKYLHFAFVIMGNLLGDADGAAPAPAQPRRPIETRWWPLAERVCSTPTDNDCRLTSAMPPKSRTLSGELPSRRGFGTPVAAGWRPGRGGSRGVHFVSHSNEWRISGLVSLSGQGERIDSLEIVEWVSSGAVGGVIKSLIKLISNPKVLLMNNTN